MTTVAELMARHKHWQTMIEHARTHDLNPAAIEAMADQDDRASEAAIRDAFSGTAGELPVAVPTVMAWDGKLWVYAKGEPGHFREGLFEVIPVKAEQMHLKTPKVAPSS